MSNSATCLDLLQTWVLVDAMNNASGLMIPPLQPSGSAGPGPSMADMAVEEQEKEMKRTQVHASAVKKCVMKLLM